MTDQYSICFSRSAPRRESGNWSVGGHLATDHRSPFWVICPLTSLPPDLSVVTWLLTPRSPLLAIASLISLSPRPRVTLRVVHVVLCCWRHRLPMTDRITVGCTSTLKSVMAENTIAPPTQNTSNVLLKEAHNWILTEFSLAFRLLVCKVWKRVKRTSLSLSKRPIYLWLKRFCHVVASNSSITVGRPSRHRNLSQGWLQWVRLPFRSATGAGWSLRHQLICPISEGSSILSVHCPLTSHACRSLLERDSTESYRLQWFSRGGAYSRFPTPLCMVSVVWASLHW